MTFYCKRAELDVEREECENCQLFEDCKKEGYLSEIDEKYGFNYSERNKLSSLEKAVQRALRPNKSKKDLYLRKITGTMWKFYHN